MLKLKFSLLELHQGFFFPAHWRLSPKTLVNLAVPFLSNLSLPLPLLQKCLEGTLSVGMRAKCDPTPMEVVIPGCFCGVLVGRTSQLPRPAGRVSDLSNWELVLSLLLLVVGLQLQKEGGRTLLYWSCSAATPIGLSLLPLPLLPSHLPTAGPELAVPTEVVFKNRTFHQTDLVGQWTNSQPVPVTRLVSVC